MPSRRNPVANSSVSVTSAIMDAGTTQTALAKMPPTTCPTMSGKGWPTPKGRPLPISKVAMSNREAEEMVAMTYRVRLSVRRAVGIEEAAPQAVGAQELDEVRAVEGVGVRPDGVPRTEGGRGGRRRGAERVRARRGVVAVGVAGRVDGELAPLRVEVKKASDSGVFHDDETASDGDGPAEALDGILRAVLSVRRGGDDRRTGGIEGIEVI